MNYRLLLTVLLSTLATALWAQGTTPAELKIEIAADRPAALYRCGETARFACTARLGDQQLVAGKFSWVLTLDGGKLLEQGEGEWGEAPVEVTGTLTQPGILRCMVTVHEGQPQPVRALGGAAFEPERIQPAIIEPADFVAYWEDTRAALRALPADVVLEKSEQHSTATVDVYQLSLANLGGVRVYAWLGLPVKEGPCPALLTVPAAGYFPPSGTDVVGWANRGFVAASLYAHAYPLDWPREKYEELGKGQLADYRLRGRENRDTYYFRQVFMGCTRLMDYLMALPQWDGEHLLVHGSSQGGALSLVCAGLEPRVTAIAANVPALCDHAGRAGGYQPGWPGLVPADQPSVAAVAPYYDAVNFARHARCATLMGVGYIDTTCPPMGIYGAFNMLPEPKRIIASPQMGHAMDPLYAQMRNEMISAWGKLSPQAP
jgi:cephalosporin-C deacetylase